MYSLDKTNKAGKLLLAVGIAALFSMPAHSVHVKTDLTPLGIELDGDVDSGAGDDWDRVYADCGIGGPCEPVSTGASRQSFQSDAGLPDSTSFTGSKDFDPVSEWQCTEGQVQGKSDIQYAYGAVYDAVEDPNAVVQRPEKFLYAGMDRRSFNGTSYMGIWLFQQPVGCVSAGGATPFSGNKTDGDLLLIINYTNGGAVNEVLTYRWTDPNLIPEDGDECLGGAKGAPGEECINEGEIFYIQFDDSTEPPTPVANVDCDLSDPEDLACGNTDGANPLTTPWRADSPLEENAFFEAGINLTQFALDDAVSGSECYSSVMIETRSSAELTADLKDFVFLDLATCGTVTVEKSTNVATAEAFNFSISPAAGNNDLSAFALADGESITIDAVENGTYVFTETTVPNEDWSLADVTCNEGVLSVDLVTRALELDVTTEEDIVCTFNNELALPDGSLLISKSCDTTSGADGSWTFTLTGPEGSLENSTTEACNDGSVTLTCESPTNSVTCEGLEPGAYTITEDDPDQAPWNLTNIDCSGGASVSCDVNSGSTASIELADGLGTGSGAARFTNTEEATIRIIKQTVPADLDDVFDFSGDLGAFQLTDGGAPKEVANLIPGDTYSVTEEDAPGFTITAFSCSGTNWAGTGDGDTVEITPDPGETVTCTVVNTQNAGTIQVCKDTVPAGALTAFQFTLAGPSAGLPVSADLVDGECSEPAVVAVGSGYSVVEAAEEGWELTSATCSDGSPVGNISVEADEAVVCTFVNTQLNPAISIVKSPESQLIDLGGTAFWTIEVTNTGDVDFVDVDVSDELAPDCDIGSIGSLAAGASYVFDCSLSGIGSPLTNVACAAGQPEGFSTAVEDCDSARVSFPVKDVPVDGRWALILLTLLMIAGAWTRRYDWR